MGNLKNIAKGLFHFAPLGWSISLLCAFGITTSLASPVGAESAETAPRELKEVINKIEAAANRQDVEAVMRFYSRDFTNSDGLSYSSLYQALTQMWERYPKLKYTTELESWEREGDRLVAETVTYIEGSRKNGSRLINLNSTLRSRQYFTDQKVIKQEVLAERTKLTSGKNPPQIKVNLPEKVRIGQRFGFDVIVLQPLGSEVLLGAAIEERTGSDRYLNPSNIKLEGLSAGGIFKLVQAPLLPDNLWYSAIVVRQDGMVLLTQRVRVQD